MIDICVKSRIALSNLPGLSGLMGKGIMVTFKGRRTLTNLLSDQLGIESEYLTNRIQTIFLNSQPVDNTDKVFLVDGDTVALSAAMPGLVGTTFRKGGHLAEFRKRISYQRGVTNEEHLSTGTVTIRLFNVVAKELGPPLMEMGQVVDVEAALTFLKLIMPSLADNEASVMVDGEKVSYESVMSRDFSKEQTIRLSIASVAAF